MLRNPDPVSIPNAQPPHVRETRPRPRPRRRKLAARVEPWRVEPPNSGIGITQLPPHNLKRAKGLLARVEQHNKTENSTDCDNVTGSRRVCLCARVCGGVL